jgi:hypothetical protein
MSPEVTVRRVYDDLPPREPGCSSTGCSRGEYARTPCIWTSGSAMSPRPPSCGNGTGTTPRSSPSSAAATSQNWPSRDRGPGRPPHRDQGRRPRQRRRSGGDSVPGLPVGEPRRRRRVSPPGSWRGRRRPTAREAVSRDGRGRRRHPARAVPCIRCRALARGSLAGRPGLPRRRSPRR